MDIQQLAKQLLQRNDWVILDTETTGLDGYAEAVQIGILSPTGDILLDTLVRPFHSIPNAAFRIHGITNEMVADAPTILDVWENLYYYLSYHPIVVYNADYDRRIIRQSVSMALDDTPPPWPQLDFLNEIRDKWVDVMEPYAEFWGEWSEWHQSYTWQKLTNACWQQGVPVINEHSAIGDCKMTLALLKKLAEVE